ASQRVGQDRPARTARSCGGSGRDFPPGARRDAFGGGFCEDGEGARLMGKSRLEAFSDGVIAIIITIMVLELKVPHGSDLAALRPILPTFLSYVLSFVFIGIYWNNHHHLIHAAEGVNGKMLWA